MSDHQQKKAQTSFRRFLIIRVGILIWICLGAYLSYYHASSYLTARQSEYWPSVPGIISINQGFFRKGLSYTYTVGGVTYTSDRVTFGELGNRTRSQSWAAFSNLPDGSEVKVYHRHQHPQESTLVTQLHHGSKFQLWLGVALLLSGGVMLLLSPILYRKA